MLFPLRRLHLVLIPLFLPVLRTDASPSQRYMDIIIAGAKELNLKEEYVNKLESIKTQRVCKPLKYIAYNYLFFLGAVLKLNMRFLTQMINKMLWFVYVRQDHPIKAMRGLSQAMIMLVLLPSSFLGWCFKTVVHDVMGKPLPPMIRILSGAPPSGANINNTTITTEIKR